MTDRSSQVETTVDHRCWKMLDLELAASVASFCLLAGCFTSRGRAFWAGAWAFLGFPLPAVF